MSHLDFFTESTWLPTWFFPKVGNCTEMHAISKIIVESDHKIDTTSKKFHPATAKGYFCTFIFLILLCDLTRRVRIWPLFDPSDTPWPTNQGSKVKNRNFGLAYSVSCRTRRIRIWPPFSPQDTFWHSIQGLKVKITKFWFFWPNIAKNLWVTHHLKDLFTGFSIQYNTCGSLTPWWR